jgi:hypothetical protein
LSCLPGEEYNLTHAKYGIITEVAELCDVAKKNFWYGKAIDHVNVKEEIGDIMWYMAIIMRKFPDIGLSTNRHPGEFGLRETSSFLEFTDCLYAHSVRLTGWLDLLYPTGAVREGSYLRQVEDSVKRDSGHFLDFICTFCLRFGYDINAIMGTNIEKLKARFPEKFSSENAIIRNLNKERDILEKGN